MAKAGAALRLVSMRHNTRAPACASALVRCSCSSLRSQNTMASRKTRQPRPFANFWVHAHPTAEAQDVGDIARAFVLIWVYERNLDLAERYACEHLTELGWIVEKVASRRQPSIRQMALLHEGEIELVRVAREHGIATFFRAQKRDGIEAAESSGHQRLRRLSATKSAARTAAFWRHEQSMRKVLSRKRCLHPEASPSHCSKIARAHSVQRGGGLSKISRDGHVYRLNTDLASLERGKGLHASLVGIGVASTFPGLCTRHDDATFAPIEKHVFSATPEQCFLFAYRAILQATYAKQAWSQSFESQRSFLQTQPGPTRNAMGPVLAWQEKGTNSGLDAAMAEKALFDGMLKSRRWDDLRFALFRFERVPDIMLCSAWNPMVDFDGKLLENAARLGSLTERPDVVTINTFSTEDGGALLLAWHRASDRASSQFAASLVAVPPDQLSDAIVRLGFESSENMYLRPAWWDSLKDDARDDLLARFAYTVDLRSPIRPDALADDGQRLAAWNPVSLSVRVSDGEGVTTASCTVP